MKYLPLPTLDELEDQFIIDLDSGIVRNKKNNKVVGYQRPSGYIYISYNCKCYAAHRLIWKYAHGADPVHDIDHDNGIRNDNRLCNLFDRPHRENCLRQQRIKHQGGQLKKDQKWTELGKQHQKELMRKRRAKNKQ